MQNNKRWGMVFVSSISRAICQTVPHCLV